MVPKTSICDTMKRLLTAIIVAFVINAAMAQQEDFESYRNRMLAGFGAYRDKALSDYASYRQKINADYAEHMRQVWREFKAFKGEPVPEDDVKPVPPLPYEEKQQDEPVIEQEIPVVPEVIPAPSPQPQPQPIEPIEEKPIVVPIYFTVGYCGTEIKVRLSQQEKFRLPSLREVDIADIWNSLNNDAYTNLLYDCLTWRDKLQLCDWAYLCMLSTLCDSFFGEDSSESTLLLAWLYCQSGYTMRLGAYEGHLEMLFASEHKIYNMPYFVLGNQYFYPIHQTEQSLRIFDHAFEGERAMSLLIDGDQKLAVQTSKFRQITSRDYPQLTVNVQTNKNDLLFYNSYPTSELHNNPMTRWAMYANVPLSEVSRRQLYSALQQFIEGKTQIDAANCLLNWVQTGFVYEYDDKVWGGDRAFFAEETLFYPYCDCEDRSILFSRLIRDLLKLDVVLVYYPGHLATAVRFTETVRGDYLMLDGRRYVICDPTYIGAPVGRTMPNMDNTKARAILLQ